MTKRLSVLLVPALLAACTAGPDYKGPPSVAAPGARFVRATDPAVTDAPGLARWWETLGDPTLTTLVDDALAHLLDGERELLARLDAAEQQDLAALLRRLLRPFESDRS